MSAFDGSALDAMLRNLQVTDVVIVGAWTNHRRRAHGCRGLRLCGQCGLDATSSVNADWQRVALGYALTNIATISTPEEVAAALVGAMG